MQDEMQNADSIHFVLEFVLQICEGREFFIVLKNWRILFLLHLRKLTSIKRKMYANWLTRYLTGGFISLATSGSLLPTQKETVDEKSIFHI